MANYFVRPKMQLHRVVETMVRGKEKKTTKLYQAGEQIEKITDLEIKHYQHLIETEEQVKSRQPKTTTKKSEDK